MEYDNYDVDEAQKVLDEARRELDPYLWPDPDEGEEGQRVRVLVALVGEVLEVAVATLKKVEELEREVRVRSSTD